MTDWDIMIVGGGIAGASLGAEIAAKRRTLIIEAEEFCGFHATGRSAAFWLESYGGP
jgi:D-arginine dehydrogenase